MKATANTDLVSRLIDVLEEATEGRVVVPRAATGSNSIRRLGLDSLTMLSFLIAVEDTFGIEWDDDMPEAVITSFDGMAAYIAGELLYGS